MNRSTNRSVSGDRKSRPSSVSVTAGIWKTIPSEVWNVAYMALCRELTRMLYYRRLQHVS